MHVTKAIKAVLKPAIIKNKWVGLLSIRGGGSAIEFTPETNKAWLLE